MTVERKSIETPIVNPMPTINREDETEAQRARVAGSISNRAGISGRKGAKSFNSEDPASIASLKAAEQDAKSRFLTRGNNY